MKIVEQGYKILSLPEELLQMIEKAGRTCYKSEDKITDNSAGKFAKMLIDRGHHAMIEFGSIIVKFITNRGVTHEMVRHRLCSFAQESTRYVNYTGKEMEFILPVWLSDTLLGIWPRKTAGSHDIHLWINAMSDTERRYNSLIALGWRPEQAREVLPNSLKTEIVVMANIREWRHIFSLRCSKEAHPQMRELMRPLLRDLQSRVPVVFDDIEY